MKKVLFSAILAIFAVLITLGLAEIILRVFFPPAVSDEVKLDTHGIYKLSDDPILVYEHRPNSTSEDVQRKIKLRKSETEVPSQPIINYSINNLGFRGENINPDDTLPLLVTLGDSNTFGLGLNDRDTFPYRLQKLLRNSKSQMQVVNAGVAGYSTATERRFYQTHVKKLKPKILLHIWCMNDVIENPTATYHTDIRMVMVHHFPLFGENTRIWMYNHSHIFMRIVEAYNLIMLDIDPDKFAFVGARDYRWIFQKALADPKNPAWLRTAGHMEKLFEEARADGVKTALVIIPFQNQVYEDSVFRYYDPTPARKQLADFAARLDVPIIDVTDDFLANKDKDLFMDICHLDPEGAQVTAEQIQKWLWEKGWVEKPASEPVEKSTETQLPASP